MTTIVCTADKTMPLSELLQQNILLFMQPCGGNGTCGKCLCYVQGDLLPPTQAETEKLTGISSRDGFFPRLICHAYVTGTIQILIPEQKNTLRISKNDTDSTDAIWGDAKNKVNTDLKDTILGIAVDIGTTTISMVLVSIKSGQNLAEIHAYNRQSTFGADVMSRIAWAKEHGHTAISQILNEQLQSMLDELTETSKTAYASIHHVVLTGNTVMLHFAAGISPVAMGMAPYTPNTRFGYVSDITDIFPSLPHAQLYFPPCISAFVGADISCGILAADMLSDTKNSLLIDIGTNGEMVLRKQNQWYSTAVAAGPAFEGAQIDMGMLGVSGAIDSIWEDRGIIHYHTIDDIPPKGICGSGLFSTAALLLDMKIISERGSMDTETVELGDSHVWLTRKDIRELQLAKASVAAGIDTLLHEAGIDDDAIDELILAGGFGSYLKPKDAVRIGMIKASFLPKIRPTGNLALEGAKMLLNSEKRETLKHAVSQIQSVTLSGNPMFADLYMEHMMFPESDE